MGVKRFGDWDKAKSKLNGQIGVRLAMALKSATIRNAVLLVREIKKGIQQQAPGGIRGHHTTPQRGNDRYTGATVPAPTTAFYMENISRYSYTL